MATVQFILHYFLHFIFPALIAWRFFPQRWKTVYLVFLLTMLVDLDHLVADPIFMACRCSIGFHPLHSWIACGIYLLMLLHPRTRVVAIGLLMHMITDGIDCILSSYTCA
jgi:hypothetical protein